MNSRIGISAALFVATIALYAQVGSHGFVDKDDPFYIVHSPFLQAGLSLETVVRCFTEPHRGNWAPLSELSYVIGHAIHGFEPAGYHLTNVVIHALSAVVLFLALARMTGAVGPSAFVAAVFAFHPLHVESVAWASERKDTLSGLFWMLALWSHARFAEAPGRRRYALTLAFLACALMSKASAVTLPFVLLLLDYWPLGRLRGQNGALFDAARLRRVAAEKIPMFSLVIASSVLTLLLQSDAGAMGTQGTDLALGYRVANALESFVIYLGAAVWPAGLASFYPHPREAVSLVSAALSGTLLVVASGAVVAVARTRPYLMVGWYWYLGTLIPMIGLVQVGMQARADRYMYLPLIGLTLMLAWGLRDLAQLKPGWRRLLAPVALAVLAAQAWVAWPQIGTWRSALTLHQRAVDVVPNNFLAHHRLSVVYAKVENFAEALRHAKESVRLEPNYPIARYQLARILANGGDRVRALEQYQRGLVFEPNAVVPLGAIGRLYEQIGSQELAAATYRKVLSIDPQQIAVANNLSWILATSSRDDVRAPAEAVRIAERVAKAVGDDASVLDTLAAGYAAANRFEDAVRTAERALILAAPQPELALEIQEHLDHYRSGDALFLSSAP